MHIGPWVVLVLFIAGACLSACGESDDGQGGAGTSAGVGGDGAASGVGGATGGAGGETGGAGGMTGGTGGVAGVMPGGAGGMAGGAGGMTGGMGGMTGGVGGAGGMTGGMTGGMDGMTGGMGGMTGGMGGMTGGMGGMTGGMGGMDMEAATFTDVYAIIEMRCGGGPSGCHIGGSPGTLNMNSKMQAFENLVGVASHECNGETRVVAGDADASLIIKALEGTACTARMPKGRAALPADQIATIREWIDAGAMNN